MSETNNIRSVEDLLRALNAGLKPKYLCFWGHQPERDGSVGKGSLSQWFAADFTVDGDRYASAEHFMMAEKARLFGDEEARAAILSARSPASAKQLWRSVRNFDERRWSDERFEIVVRGNAAKFGQSPSMREFLLRTGNKVLVEASPSDRIWGIGITAQDGFALQPQKWRGLNLLGFALMAAREQLRTGDKR